MTDSLDIERALAKMAHEIDVAAYVSNGERWVPFMICSCGFETSIGHRKWEDVGVEMDEHLS